VCCNDEASIRYLLAHGANPSLGPKFGTQTPPPLRRPISTSAWILNDAAEHCSPAIFALLLSHGASLTGANAMPLHYAASQMSCARSGAYTDRMPMMRYLVEDLGLDINAVDDAIKIADDGREQVGTPLQYAIRFSRVEEAKWLLAKGADPDKRNQSGRSAREDAERLPEGYELKDLLRDAGRQRGHRDSEVTYYAVFGRDVA
jgi:ankyrin repeat protein